MSSIKFTIDGVEVEAREGETIWQVAQRHDVDIPHLCYSTAPTYRGLASRGLIRKDYLNGENGTGGVYLWESREAAQAWFTEERVAELTRRFGVRPRLTWYDTYVTVDNLKDETRVNGKSIELVA